MEENHAVCSHMSVQTEGKTDQVKCNCLRHRRERLLSKFADFEKIKNKLDAEIEIWDDIIVLAKKLCMITAMTDFTRGKGLLKHVSDVICAAKMISGSGINVLTEWIASRCPDQSCTQDLLAYLKQIKLYSHQLKICNQVKTEIQNLRGKCFMSALDSVTSPIQAAKT